MTLSKSMKVAVLVANGFEESNFLAAQRFFQEKGVFVKIVSMNQGLVNGWHGEGWGHNYAVDVPLNSALGVDYDALVIPGGKRSLEKLKMTAHTRRFIGSFMNANKPVCVMGDAVDIMMHTQQSEGRMMSGADDVCQMDGNMMTGNCDQAYFDMMGELFTNYEVAKAA